MLLNHLDLLLTERGRAMLTGKLPDGGRRNRLFAEAVRKLTATPEAVPCNLNIEHVEQAAGILASAYDGCASTTQLSNTSRLTKATITAAMKLLTTHGLIAEMNDENWGIPDIDGQAAPPRWT